MLPSVGCRAKQVNALAFDQLLIIVKDPLELGADFGRAAARGDDVFAALNSVVSPKISVRPRLTTARRRARRWGRRPGGSRVRFAALGAHDQLAHRERLARKLGGVLHELLRLARRGLRWS